jgi:hypothetical protein
MAKKGAGSSGGGKKRCRTTSSCNSRSKSNNVPTTSSKTSAPAAFLPSNNKKKAKKDEKMMKKQQGLLLDDDKSSGVMSAVTTAPATATTAATVLATPAAANHHTSILDERRRVQRREQRTAVLTHNTSEKRNAMRLKLHITRTKRELEIQKAQLTSWDPVSYRQAQLEKQKKAAEEEQAAQSGEPLQKQKRGRKGPESWKLKGAARPAWQVYDFDTRYVCPHIAAHEQHQERTKRSLNLLALCRQQQEKPHLKPPTILLSSSILSNDKKNEKNSSNDSANDDNDDNIDPEKDNEEEEEERDDALMFICRDYLALLMELGHLYLQAKQFKSAREAWLQCLELDYAGMTTAGDELMRMYLDLQRHEAAFRLGQRLQNKNKMINSDLSNSKKIRSSSSGSGSVWIHYSTALVAWHLKDEKAAQYVEQAIRFNPFCAYYLAFWNTFAGVMEYTHELEQGEDGDDAPPQSSLEEAIQYCSSNDNQQAKRWIAMGGYVALREILLQTIQTKHPTLTRTDVDWNTRLVKLEQFCQEQEDAEAAIAAAVAANEQQQEENDDKNHTMDSSSLEAATDKKDEQQEEAAYSSSSSHNDGDDDDDEKSNGSTSSESDVPPKVDLAMFVGMFRTAMEMVQEEDPRFALVH